MVDFTGKIPAGVTFALTIVASLSDVVPTEYSIYKPYMLLSGIVLSLFLVRSDIAKAWPKEVSCPLKKYCLNEKHFRFLSIQKYVTIYEDGTGLEHAIYEVVNEGKQNMRRFPYRLSRFLVTMEPIAQLCAQNNFEIKSLDGHNLNWKAIKDEEHKKVICIEYNEDIRPGEHRKYSIRCQQRGAYKTKRDELPSGECECNGTTLIYICNRYHIRLTFCPNYRYSNLRYCVRSPSHEAISELCRDLIPHEDTQTGGTYYEVEEINPWRNFQYRIEWVPEN